MMDQSIVSKPTILLYATEHISEDVGIGVDDEAIVLTYKNIPTHQFI